MKVKHSWIDGPNNILYELRCLRTQKKTLISVVEKTVRSSAWFAHSECVLMTMLCSTNAEERSWAVDKILGIRGKELLGDKSARSREPPVLNLNAEKLVDLISWEGATEPIFTCDISSRELNKIRQEAMSAPYYCNQALTLRMI